MTIGRIRMRMAGLTYSKNVLISTDLARMAKNDFQKTGFGTAICGKKTFSKQRLMKRTGNLQEEICSMANLRLALINAKKGKRKQYGVKLFEQNEEANLLAIYDLLNKKEYRTSLYKTFTIYEPKERLISKLPFMDRVIHHAEMLVVGPIITKTFTADTHSAIKGRGNHGALRQIKRALRDVENTQYCLQLDIQKFYPSINHRILKLQLQRKIKDRETLDMLFEAIDSAPGLPIGNLLSQYFSNFYMTPFDHWVKEKQDARHYIRYADDMAFFSDTKEYLHQLLRKIRIYLKEVLNLELKSNYKIFPVAKCGLNMVGCISYHDRIRIRPETKRRYARMLAGNPNPRSIASYEGLFKHANCRHLVKTINLKNQQRIRS